MKNHLKALIEFFVAFAVFILLLFLIRLYDIDLKISDYAHNTSSFELGNFLQILAWIGKYASVIFCGFLIIILPWMWKKKHKLRREALFAVLLLIIGPGFINNIILKPLFQRPRPVEIQRYNENSTIKFVPPLSIGQHDKGRSFPSGHAAAAFFFIFPWFCLRYRKKFKLFLLLPGLIFGCGVSYLRILEGRHFLSDTIASLGLVYLSATILAYAVFSMNNEEISNNNFNTDDAK